MRIVPSLLVLLTPFLAKGFEASSLHEAIRERQETLQRLEGERQDTDATLRSLGKSPEELSPAAQGSPLPDHEPGETVAVADGGMLFDTENSCVTYLSNVRVNDDRLQMRCSRRLSIHFPRQSLPGEKEEASPRPSSPPSEEGNAPEQGSPSAPPPHPTAEGSAEEATNPPEQEPLEVTAQEALVDLALNRILLIGEKASPSLVLRRGPQELTLAPEQQDVEARLLMDDNGDIYLPEGKLSFTWVDEQGKISKLTTEGGSVYFHTERKELILMGPSVLETEDGSLRCRESLAISFLADEKKESSSDSGKLMSPLTSLRFSGIAGAEARGEVVAVMPGTESRPPSELRGDLLTYDASTGACHLSGKNCLLAFGNSRLHTDGDVKLEGNGDIFLTGDRIDGIYERPARIPNGDAVKGQFHTAPSLVFRAEDNTLTASGGLTLREEGGAFSCTGPLEVVLMTRPGSAPKPLPARRGMPTLALARCNDVARLRASGQVMLHSGDTPDAPPVELRGSHLEADLQTGEALLTAAGGEQARFCYGQYELAATNAEGPSRIQVHENGDVEAQGSRVLATLPEQGGLVHVSCDDSLHLLREEAKLTLGSRAEVHAPQGLLTTRGGVEAMLLTGPSEAAKPIHPRFPKLVYNIAGLRHARTQEGGTLRSSQGSMQCTGPISLTMKNEPKGADASPLAQIQEAFASGQVAVAGKDSTGRLVRATGERLEYSDKTRLLRLSGQRVTLADAYNTHTASGPNACVTIDEKRVTRIVGTRHETSATRIHEQLEQQKQKKED